MARKTNRAKTSPTKPKKTQPSRTKAKSWEPRQSGGGPAGKAPGRKTGTGGAGGKEPEEVGAEEPKLVAPPAGPKRPPWDEYFLKLAMLASERATCPRMHCGCVIVKDRFVLATGYNGSLPGLPHCDEVGCLVVDGHCVRTNHAEMNALCQATRHGIPVVGSTAYVTNMPCTNCAKALIAAGIARVVVFSDYHDTLAMRFFTEAGVQVARVPMPDLTIHYNIAAYSSARKTEKSQ